MEKYKIMKKYSRNRKKYKIYWELKAFKSK